MSETSIKDEVIHRRDADGAMLCLIERTCMTHPRPFVLRTQEASLIMSAALMCKHETLHSTVNHYLPHRLSQECNRVRSRVYNSETRKHNYNSMLISLSLSDSELFVQHFWSFLFLASHAHYAQISYWVESESVTWSELWVEQINLALRILGSVMMQNELGNMSTVQTIDVSAARVWVSWHPMKRQSRLFISFERAYWFWHAFLYFLY